MKPFLTVTLAATGIAICACSASSPSAQPAHTVTVTANAAASRVAAAKPAPSPTTSAAAANCTSKDLSVSAGAPQGYKSGLQLALMFKNTGNTPCTLAGYPTVTQATGTPPASVGQPAAQDPSAPRMAVTVPPNGVASARLEIADSANYAAGSCKPVKVTSLAVVPPNEKTALHIAFGSTACKGSAKLMTVTTVQQGSGA
jgi:hypothetical protein